MLVRLKKPDYGAVSLAMVKTHLRLNHSDEDEYLIHIIGVAGEILENTMGQSLLEQTWQYLWYNPMDGVPSLRSGTGEVLTIPIPFPPIVEIVSIQALFPNNKSKEIKRYQLRQQGRKAELTVSCDYPALQIIYGAGMAKRPPDLPAPLLQALLHMIAHLYENRQCPDGAAMPILSHLITPFLSKGLS